MNNFYLFSWLLGQGVWKNYEEEVQTEEKFVQLQKQNKNWICSMCTAKKQVIQKINTLLISILIVFMFIMHLELQYNNTAMTALE